jgi:hypothetical protein
VWTLPSGILEGTDGARSPRFASLFRFVLSFRSIVMKARSAKLMYMIRANVHPEPECSEFIMGGRRRKSLCYTRPEHVIDRKISKTFQSG